jgi:hypothetical protein
MNEKKDPKETATFERTVLKNILTQNALIRLLEKKGIISGKELREEIDDPGGKKSARVNKRTQKRFIGRCEIDFTSAGVTHKGLSSDFSLNGLFIRTNHSLPEGAIIDIVVYLPEGATSMMKGRVVRSLRTAIGKALGTQIKSIKNGMGVELIKKDTNYLHFIKSFLDR